ncbi:MAG: TonB-dependent receptor domain-containing protein [Terriglobia bacterium]
MRGQSAGWGSLGLGGIVGWLALTTSLAFAQLPTATISGQVRDSSGAAIPGATVTVTSGETGRTRSTMTSGSGRFSVAGLAVGTYDVRAEAVSFRPEIRRELKLEVGQEAVLNFSLAVGAVLEAVTVTAEAPLVDTTSGSLGGLVNDERLAELPLNGRNFNDLVLLQPGINVHRPVSTTSSSARGLAFSSNGASIYSNYMVMDGATLTAARGRNGPSMSGSMLGVEGIREFRVITNAFPAQYGVAMGSQIVVVSKNGTNQFHGSVFEFLRNDKLDARDFFAPEKLPLRRNNFGGSLGGPLRQDRAFFFVTYEGFRERLTEPHVLTTVTEAARQDNFFPGVRVADAVKPYLSLYPLPNGPLPSDPTGASGLGRYTFSFSQPTKEDYGQARGDYNFSDTDNAFFRYTLVDSAVVQLPFFPGHEDTGTSRGQYLTFGENHTFSSTLLNVFSLSYSRSLEVNDSPSDPALGFEPGLQMGNLNHQGGLSDIGPRGNAPLDFRYHDVALSNDVFWSRGDHSIKFGALIKWDQMFTLAATRLRGEYRFRDLQNFLRGNANRLRLVTPGAITDRTYHWYVLGFYVQDDWRVRSNLTLNFGLRYEPHTTVDEIRGRGLTLRDPVRDAAFTPGPPLFDNDSWKNWGPRFGFAWDVLGNASTSVRGGFALLYDITSNIGNTAVHGTANPPLSSSATLTSNLTFPRTVVPASAAGRSIRTFDYHLQQPHMLHWNLTVERQLPADMAVSLSYAASRGINLLQSKEGNPTVPSGVRSGNDCVRAGSSYVYDPSGPKCWLGNEPRLNPAFLESEFKTAGGDSWYNSMQIQIQKRLSRGLQFQSSYTWSKSLDTTIGQYGGESGGTPNIGRDPDNPAYDKGPSDFDNRHVWTFNTLYVLPLPERSGIAGTLLSGWRVGTIVTLRSGVPFSPMIAGNQSRSGVAGAGDDRPDLKPGLKPDDIIRGGPDEYFDGSAYQTQPLGFLGSSSRNFLTGPALANWDFSIRKDTPVPFLGEAGRLEFRAEFFNFLNHPNFRVPSEEGVRINTPTTGEITRTVSQVGRNAQLALKLVF